MPTAPLRGRIAATGFSSGHRFVIGHWDQSPIGPFSDVMWADPSGVRTLLASSVEARDFVEWVYRFDRSEVTPIEIVDAGREFVVTAGPLQLELVRRRGVAFPVVRPRWFTRYVEGPIARAVFGVHTYGVSPTGVEEWYRATKWSPVREARGTLDGASLGERANVRPACGFGFSEPPPRPSITEVRPLLRWPDDKVRWDADTPGR